MSTCNCPSLFRPGKIGNVEIRNRSVMPSMGLSSTVGGFVNDTCIRHYVERATAAPPTTKPARRAASASYASRSRASTPRSA